MANLNDKQYTISPQSTIITVQDSNIPVGTIQTYEYRTVRNKQPINVLGSEAPLQIGRGQRTTAGRFTGVVLTGGFIYELVSNQTMFQKFQLIFENADKSSSVINFDDKLDQQLSKYFAILNKLGLSTSKISEGDAIDAMINKVRKLVGEGPLRYDSTKQEELNSQIEAQEQQKQEYNSQKQEDKILKLKTLYDKLGEMLKVALRGLGSVRQRPVLYLDEFPPFNLNIVSVTIENDVKSGNKKAIVDTTTFIDLEFLSEGTSVVAGAETLIESVDFICRAAVKSQKEIDLNQQSSTARPNPLTSTQQLTDY